jgi:hypothetical protein
MTATCEMSKEDTLTIYKTSARRLQRLNVPTKTSQTIIDLPSTFLKSSLIALFDDLRIVPHDVKSYQLIMNMPSGLVIIEDKDGLEHEGTLDSLDGSEAVIRERETGTLMHISNYKSVNFEKRFSFRRVTLSYLLGGLSWLAQHTLLIDPEESRVVVFKTMAVIKNTTGVIFNLSALKLGLGDPAPYQENEVAPTGAATPAAERTTMRRGASRLALVAASPMMPPPVYESNTVSNEGVEDFEFIDIGPQTLAEHGRFDILSLVDIPIRKLYFYEISNNNTRMETGYRMIIPKDTHIPSGPIVIYNFNTKQKKLGMYLGSSMIKEQFQQDEMDVILGLSSLVRGECIVTSLDAPDAEDVEDMEHYASKSKLKSLNIVIRKDAPRIRYTTVECTFTNNSSKDAAIVVASYTLPYNEKLIEMTCKYSRIKNGKMEFNIILAPSSKKIFKCEVTSQFSI